MGCAFPKIGRLKLRWSGQTNLNLPGLGVIVAEVGLGLVQEGWRIHGADR